MSEFKGTPGPWFIENGDDIVRHPSQDFNYNYSPPVKFASGWVEGAWFGSDATEESKSNARLIAAAPDLLEALLMLQKQALQSELNSPTHEWGMEALAATRAAIAKAIGETK